MESGKADLGLVYDSAVDSGTLESCPLFDDDMALIVRHDSSLSGPQDLAALSLRLVGFPPHYALRRMIQSAGLQPDFAAEAETIDAMLGLAGDAFPPAPSCWTTTACASCRWPGRCCAAAWWR